MEPPDDANVPKSTLENEFSQGVELVEALMPIRTPSPSKVPKAPRSRVEPVSNTPSEALGAGPSH